LESVSGASQSAMDSPRITYTPRPDATPEAELNVLANVYAYLIECHHSKQAAKPAQLRTGEAKSSRQRKEAEMP
jgi:hypothetical protein